MKALQGSRGKPTTRADGLVLCWGRGGFVVACLDRIAAQANLRNPVYPVQTHVIEFKESASRHPHRNSPLICANPNEVRQIRRYIHFTITTARSRRASPTPESSVTATNLGTPSEGQLKCDMPLCKTIHLQYDVDLVYQGTCGHVWQ